MESVGATIPSSERREREKKIVITRFERGVEPLGEGGSPFEADCDDWVTGKSEAFSEAEGTPGEGITGMVRRLLLI